MVTDPNTTGARTKLLFLGTSAAMPDIGCDTASFLINHRYLVDTGWSVVHNLRANGMDPLKIEYIFFTHFHHDHYLSLPSLLFYWLIKGKDLSALTILGPAKDVSRVVDRAIQFLQPEMFEVAPSLPTIVALGHGNSYEVEDFRVDVHGTIHPVQALCYRFLDKRSGQVFSFTGDTAYHPPLAQHVRGSELLIHEASLGPVNADPTSNAALHSGAVDAARIADAAGVKRLLLVHGKLETANACVEAASRTFKGEILWPRVGQTVFVGSSEPSL